MIKRICLLPVILGLSLIGFAQTKPQVRPLDPGKAVEREISGGESHTYQISLTAGQFVRVVVDQKAIDLALMLVAPDGKQLVEVDLGVAGWLEPLSAEAAASGDYRLTVRAKGSAALAGSYQVRLEVKAVATTQDRQRLSAEKLLAEARKSLLKRAAEPALENAQPALALCRELGDRYWEGFALFLIGTAHSLAQKHEQALDSYSQALAIMRELKDRAGEANTLKNMGNANISLGRNEQAIECLEQALVFYREVKNRSMESNALINLSFANLNLSRTQKAVEYLEQALAFHREMKNRADEAYVLSALGRASSKLSRYETAIEYFGQALAIAREVKDPAAEGSALSNLGEAYNRLGRPEKAIEYLEQARPIMIANKHRLGEASALSELGRAYSRLSRYETAIEYYERALAIDREIKNRVNEGNQLNNLGVAYSRLRRPERAIEYFEQALIIAREVKFRLNELEALNNLGIAYGSLGRRGKAIESHEQALVISREIHARDYEADTLYGLASAESAQGNFPAARTHVEQSLAIAESLRADEITSPELRASFLSGVQNSYQLYTDLLMRQHTLEPTKGFDALAVEVSERQRARSLLDLLGEARADLRRGLDAALIERERDLGRKLNDKARLLTEAGKPEQAAALKQEISQLENDYERAQAAIRKASPRYAALVQPQPLKLTEIQAQLDADSLLLEYSLGEERSYLWAISKDSLSSYELPKGEVIDKNARQVYALLTVRGTNKSGETSLQRSERVMQGETALVAAAQSLSQTLLGPVAAQLSNKRLVIVADGALQYIPFAMLPDPAASKPTVGGRSSVVGKNQPLVVQHEVVSLPSASALAIQRSELAGRQPAPKMLAVIADPVFDRSDSRFTTSATETVDKTLTQTITGDDARSIEHLAEKSDDKPGTTTRRLVIPRLPFTRQEAIQLLALTAKNSSFGAIGFQASRETVLDPALSQYRYVHFATHGVLDSVRPGLSSLVLSMVDEQGKPQDGFLRANDIYNLKLPAELVVLSACQTGLGKDIKGEGLVGLTRGFMYAGAARVVVSLWNVNDKATAELMTKFYEKMLKQGERPAAALRAAQVEMWRQKQWQSPYYWAAFTMQGEWR
jgi:CHAT domain-containing protein